MGDGAHGEATGLHADLIEDVLPQEQPHSSPSLRRNLRQIRVQKVHPDVPRIVVGAASQGKGLCHDHSPKGLPVRSPASLAIPTFWVPGLDRFYRWIGQRESNSLL